MNAKLTSLLLLLCIIVAISAAPQRKRKKDDDDMVAIKELFKDHRTMTQYKHGHQARDRRSEHSAPVFDPRLFALRRLPKNLKPIDKKRRIMCNRNKKGDVLVYEAQALQGASGPFRRPH